MGFHCLFSSCLSFSFFFFQLTHQQQEPQKLFLRLLLLMSQLKEEKRKGEIGGKQTVKALAQKLRYHNFRQMMMLKYLIVIIIKSIQTKNLQNKTRKKLLKIWKGRKKQKRK